MSTDKMPPEQRAKVEKLKRSVQLNVMPFSAEEERLQNAVNEALIKGIDPANAIKELKEYYNRVGGE